MLLVKHEFEARGGNPAAESPHLPALLQLCGQGLTRTS